MSSFKASVLVPTQTSPSRNQTIVGKISALAAEVEEFRGIPFGIVPGRWMHSKLRTELPDDEFYATSNGPKCPQPSGPNDSRTFQAPIPFPRDVKESGLSCLNLFITRPSIQALKELGKEHASLPVFVWIHGGGFGFGASTDPMWDPTRLVMKSLGSNTPIIAVSINYRLNVFGFGASSDLLSSKNLSGTGPKGCNYGLNDQHVALQWISTNISHFGGDPDKITIAGQSAGGASVHAQVLHAKMSSEKPIFRRAILQSGSMGCLGPSSLADADERWEKLCARLQIEGSGSERVEKLRLLDEEVLIQASNEEGWMVWDSIVDGISLIPTDIGSEVLVNFGHEDDSHARINDQPIEIIIGDADNEGQLFAHGLASISSYAQIEDIFHASYPSSLAASEIMLAYNLAPNSPLPELHKNMTQFISDAMFGYTSFEASHFLRLPSPQSPTTKTKSYHPTPVREYKMKYGNPFSGSKFKIAHHCIELIYLFDCFHEFLLAADEAEAGGRVPAFYEDTDAANEEVYQAARTNAELVRDIQSEWLEFITKDDVEVESSDEIKVWGFDRASKMESLTGGPERVAHKERFDVLARWGKVAMRKVLRKINGQV